MTQLGACAHGTFFGSLYFTMGAHTSHLFTDSIFCQNLNMGLQIYLILIELKLAKPNLNPTLAT